MYVDAPYALWLLLTQSVEGAALAWVLRVPYKSCTYTAYTY